MPGEEATVKEPKDRATRSIQSERQVANGNSPGMVGAIQKLLYDQRAGEQKAHAASDDSEQHAFRQAAGRWRRPRLAPIARRSGDLCASEPPLAREEEVC